MEGVYTTMGNPVMSSRGNLDMPASGYSQESKFQVGQVPVAVICGYVATVRMELLDGGGNVAFSKEYVMPYHMAACQPIPGLPAGKYQLRITAGKRELDRWSFTVE